MITIPTGSDGLHAIVFEPDAKIMHVAIAETDKDVPLCKKVQFNVSELLKD